MKPLKKVAHNRKTKRIYYEGDIVYVDKLNNIAEVLTADRKQTYLVDLRNIIYEN